jgi:hypothetical protein
MFQILSRIFSRSDGPDGTAEERVIHGAVEAILVGTDPRLRAVPDYERRLAASAMTSINHVRRMADNLRSPASLSPEGYGSDTRVHVLFGSVESMKQIVSRDAAFRTFTRDAHNASVEDAFGLLTAERQVKHVFGMDLMGETIQRDVAKTVLVFSDHRLRALAASEKDTLRLIKIGAFRQLVELARIRLARAKQGSAIADSTRDPGHERRQGPPRIPSEDFPPFDSPSGESGASDADTSGLDEIDRRLARLGPTALTLSDYLDIVADVLNHPQDHLRQMPFSVVVDRMGTLVERPDETAPDSDRVLLWEIVHADRKNPVTTMMVRLRTSDFPPASWPAEFV